MSYWWLMMMIMIFLLARAWLCKRGALSAFFYARSFSTAVFPDFYMSNGLSCIRCAVCQHVLSFLRLPCTPAHKCQEFISAFTYILSFPFTLSLLDHLSLSRLIRTRKVDTVGEKVGSICHEGDETRLQSRVEMNVGPLERQGCNQANNGSDGQ